MAFGDGTTNIVATVDDSQFKAWVKQAGDQLPFAASVGLNRTADEIQVAIRQTLDNKFTLRRKTFIERTIYRKPGEDFASKTKLQARVRVNDERDVLSKFERGGEKRPRQGRALVIPIDVKRNKSDIVPKSQSVRALLDSGKAFVRNGRVWQEVGRGRRKTLRLAYIFKDFVRLPASLGFAETGMHVARTRLEANISGAIAKVVTGTFQSGNAPKSV